MISQSLLIVGVVTYVLVWFLPVIEHRDSNLGNRVLHGWEAFWWALTTGGLSVSRLVNTSSALSNIILVLTLLDLSLASRAPHPAVRIALVVCALLNTQWWFRADFLRIGYYWWAGSFFLIASGLATRGGIAESWVSIQGVGQSALMATSMIALLAGIYAEWGRVGVDEDSKAPSDKRDDVYPDEPPIRRGSYWLLFGGIAGALLTWFFMSWISTPSATGARTPTPRVPLPLAASSSPTAPRPQSLNDSSANLAALAGKLHSTEATSPDVGSVRQEARDLRRSLESFLNDASVRDAATSAEKSLAQGEALLQNGKPESAAALFKEVSGKLEIIRASVNRNLESQTAAEQGAKKATSARQRFKREQAEQYAGSSYSRGQQMEASAQTAYRSRDYRNATSLYASARKEYDTVQMAIIEALSAEEQVRTKRKEEEQEASRLLKEAQARELQRQREQEREQVLREQNALREKATGQIRTVLLNLVTYGGGLNPELEILADFEVSGMKGVDGVVIAFLSLQEGKVYVPLIGSGNFQNGAYASARYTPGDEKSLFSKFRLAVPLSRLPLPDGTNDIRVSLYLRTGGGGQLERDLDGKSAHITLAMKTR